MNTGVHTHAHNTQSHMRAHDTRTPKHIHTHTCLQVQTHAYTNTCVHTLPVPSHTCTQPHLCTRSPADTHTYAHAHGCTLTHVPTPTHTHTHAHAYNCYTVPGPHPAVSLPHPACRPAHQQALTPRRVDGGTPFTPGPRAPVGTLSLQGQPGSCSPPGD